MRSRALVAAVGLGLLLAACGSNSSGGNGVASISQVQGSTQSSSHYPGATVLPRSVAKPNVTLTDTAGQPYDVATATAGTVTLLYFGYTHCPDVCPINMALAAVAIEKLPPAEQRRVTVVFITTDPDRDTPPVIRAWLNKFDPAFVGLTGSISEIYAAEKAVGMPLSQVEKNGSGNYEIEHAGYILAYSQDNVAHLQFDDTETAGAFTASLEHLITHGYQA